MNAIQLLLRNEEWFAAAILCALAIDALADAYQVEGYVNSCEYRRALEQFFPETYGQNDDRRERFYGALRSGLLHRVQLEARDDSRSRDQAKYITNGIALGNGDGPPREVGNHTVIHVPHLVKAVQTFYDSFKAETPGDSALGDAQSRFADRMKQQLYFEDDVGGLAKLPVFLPDKSEKFTSTATQFLSGGHLSTADDFDFGSDEV